MPSVTVIIGEDSEETAIRIARDVTREVEGAEGLSVDYIAHGGGPRADIEVAREIAEKASKARGGRICLALDRSVPGNDFYGLDVIWEAWRQLRGNVPIRELLLDRNILVVIITNFDTKEGDVLARWNAKEPGCVVAGDVRVASLRKEGDAVSVLKARAKGEKVIPVVAKNVREMCFWELLREWAR